MTLSFDSIWIFNHFATGWISLAPLSDTSFAIAYHFPEEGSFLALIVTEHDLLPAWGKPHLIDSRSPHLCSIVASSPNTIAVTYRVLGNPDYGSCIFLPGEVSDTTISWRGKSTFCETGAGVISLAPLLKNTFAIAYSDRADNLHGKATLAETGTPLGIADAGGSGGETIPVLLEGISDNHTGLTPGRTYYSASDGALTQGDTYAKIGRAVSKTEILLKIE